MRLVQYFDKGRMELTNGTVTNGLLASEIVKGQIQTGDATFRQQAPPAIPIAGDPDNPGPTYASLNQKAASLLAPAAAQVGAPVTTTVAADGTPSTGTAPADTGTMIAAFDDATKHNVPAVFATYRSKAGLLTIGVDIDNVNGALSDEATAIASNLRRSTANSYTVDNGTIGIIGGEQAFIFVLHGASKSDPSDTFTVQEWIVNHGGKEFAFDAFYKARPTELDAIIASVAFLK
jgi:hypothetical protein